MNYQVKVLLLSFGIGIIISLIILPILKRLKVGQIEREDGPQSHLKKQGTPTMGGIITIISIIIMTTIICIGYIGNQTDLIFKLLPLVLVSIGFGLVGFVDDFKKLVLKNTEGLKPSYKMLGLLIISVTFVVFLYKKVGTQTLIPIVKQYINLPVWVYIPFAIFVMLGTTNAVNLTDGIDGLATSVTTIIIATLTIIGIILDVKEVVLLGSMVCGANLAFLIFNMYPAKVFMGDTGSMALGATLAAVAILTKHELSLAVIGGVFVIETLSSIIQIYSIKRRGKKVFLMAPIHHHFEKLGWEETDIVKLFYLVGFGLGMVAVYYGVWM